MSKFGMLAQGRLITLKSRPYFSAFPSKNVLKVLQPKSDIALDNLRSLGARSASELASSRGRTAFSPYQKRCYTSKTTVWFSRIILVDNLCRKSVKRISQFGMELSNSNPGFFIPFRAFSFMR
ncbi:MAG: hypothetical protein F6K54_17295 [Okeania sp. SIO3B5]|uniref:hypothetical protein n=1 Tax=Okeania sp. SIO3B5 TaxID=2607811 RepID=UPI001401A283|nr:hypothetical protein [Okeania sp. SIO3B5]NEO54680.1 hypothetical protein [Okeania sp. SIO3B5]